MWKYTIQVSGMVCGMCEAHANESIRKEFSVKKVTSSHTKGQTIIVCEQELDEDKLRSVLSSLGYDIGTIEKEAYHKKRFLGLF